MTYAETLDHYMKQVVDAAPPLSKDQLDTLRTVFAGSEVAPQPAPIQRPISERHALYRHFDEAGVLLYVGITVNLGSRTRDHRKAAPWIEFVEHTQSEWFGTRDEASAAETAAIASERPLFNKQHASPDRDARLLAYLIDRSATHLLRLP